MYIICTDKEELCIGAELNRAWRFYILFPPPSSFFHLKSPTLSLEEKQKTRNEIREYLITRLMR
jgi:hypothetical protein